MDDSMQDFKWLFPEERLRNTPSLRQGISAEKELTFRQKEAMLIQSIGSKAHLTQLAVKTSVVFMHRFFMYRSVVYYPRVQLAIALALAGGKVEESESARKLEHLIRSTVDVLTANKNREFLDKSDQFTYDMDSHWNPKIIALKESRCSPDSVEYLEMRKLILECETEIYSVIGFQLQITHPHNFLLRMCSLLGAEGIKDLTQYAYNLATASSQLTMLCLKYKPETIATMCLNVAFKASAVQLISKDSTTKWYQVYDPETDYKEIEAVSEEFLKLMKNCPLLPTWMGMLGKLSKRSLAGPVRGPGGHSISRHPGSAAQMARRAGGSGTGQNQNVAVQRPPQVSSGSLSQPGSESSDQARSSHGDARASASVGLRPAQPAPSRPPATRNPAPAAHMQTSSSSVSSSSSSSSRPQPAAHPTYPRVPHSSRSGSSTDLSRPRDDQLRLPVSSKLDVQVTSEQERSRTHPLPHSQPLKNLSSVKPAEPAPSQVVAPDDVFSPNCYSPAAVRPPSPPFPPPSDLVDDEETGSGPSAGPVASPDTADTGSSGFPPAPASGPKLSLSDYRQRYHAKLSERSSSQAVAGAQEDSNPAALEHSFTPEQFRLKSAPSSPAEDKPFQAGADHSFSKLQDSPSNPGNPRITLKVKRDPASGESLSVKYSEGLRIKIKPPRPTIEGEGTTSVLDQSAGVGTPREEGEILEDSPSPASSTGSARRSEGLRIRLSVPKASDNNSSGISSAVAKRESDHWSSRESGHRSHHHGHHSHRSHHKSKKHKEHRSRHEGKSSGHHSSKRQCGHSYDERQAKLPRVSTSYGGMGGPPPPPLPPLPPPPSHHALQHQNSGFSINDAFVSSFPTGHDVIPDYGEDANLPAPTTPLEGIPPHHEPFHRMLEEHRAREEAKRPPLPPVPPPPPPPSFPPPPPPPSM